MGFWGTLGKALGVAGAGVGGLFTGGSTWAAIPGILSAGSAALCTIGRASGDTAKGVQDTRLLENQIAQGYDRNAIDLARLGIDQTQTRDRNLVDLARLGIDQTQNRDRNILERAGLNIGQTQARDRALLDRAALGITQAQFRDRYGMDRAALLDRMLQDRAKLGLEAPLARTKQAAYGDALQNVQDVNIDFRPQSGAATKFNVTGGLRPSMFGATARQAGGELGRQALLALLTKSDVPSMVDIPTASAALDLPEPSPLIEVPELSALSTLPELSAPHTLPTLSGPKTAGKLEKTLGGVSLAGNILGGLGALLKRRQRPSIYTNVPYGGAPPQG